MKKEKETKSKLVKGKPFLNDFHRKYVETALKENDYFQTRSYSWKDMNNQAKWLQPNGNHMKRKY